MCIRDSTDCVEVCPVDCFYEGENMLVINPDECIDCGVCEPECPIDAIKADNDESVKDKEKWLLLNKKFSALWPNISKKKEPMKDHKKFENVKQITKKTYNKCSVIQILKWKDYQVENTKGKTKYKKMLYFTDSHLVIGRAV